MTKFVGSATMILECSKCEHQWFKTFDLPTPLGDFGNALAAVRCPKCNNNGKRQKIYLLMGKRYDEAKARLLG